MQLAVMKDCLQKETSPVAMLSLNLMPASIAGIAYTAIHRIKVVILQYHFLSINYKISWGIVMSHLPWIGKSSCESHTCKPSLLDASLDCYHLRYHHHPTKCYY